MKIAVCGPRKIEEKELESCLEIGRGLASLERVVLVMGGTSGFSAEVAREVKSRRPEIEIEGFVPFVNEEEWKEYLGKGAAPFDLYDRVNWSDEEGSLKLRALKRIPKLIEGNDATVAYINQYAGGTHVEILNSLTLSIPTFVLTDDLTREKIEGFYDMSSKPVRIYENPSKLNSDLRNELSGKS